MAAIRVVTKRQPTPEEWTALRFAWRVCAHVKSNTIVFTASDRTLAVGAGQMSRVDSVNVAVMKAGGTLQGSVVASDAFFPFPDGLEVLLEAGVRAVVQPGGSVRDELSIGVAEFRGRTASPKGVFERFVRDEKQLASLEVPQPCGHPLPLYSSRGAMAPAGLVSHRALLVGDAGHLVDPLFGEGIYYAVRSAQIAAASVLGIFHDQRRSLLDYERAVTREIYAEFRIASRVARIVYTFPRLCHRLMHRYQEVINLYYDVLQGRETYQTFFHKAKGVVKASFRELLRETLPFR